MRQLSLLRLLELPLDEARPYVECDICALYNSGGTLYLCPEKDGERCLHTNWAPDNIHWGEFHCAKLLTGCPLDGINGRPCSGKFIPREEGWAYEPNPDRDRIISGRRHQLSSGWLVRLKQNLSFVIIPLSTISASASSGC